MKMSVLSPILNNIQLRLFVSREDKTELRLILDYRIFAE